jgi:hypothetical protein
VEGPEPASNAGCKSNRIAEKVDLSSQISDPLALTRFRDVECAQEKRAACESKRPKSREETPKEGGGNARRYRTAIRYTATHKVQEEK